MSLYEALLFFHIVGVFLIVAGAGIGTATGIAMARTSSVRTISMLAVIGHRAEMWVVVPGGILTFIFGTWLVDEGNFDFGDTWIALAYVLWIVAMGLGTGVLGRYVRKLHERAEQLLADGVDESDDLRVAAGAPQAVITGNVLHLITLGLLFIMVAKPGL